jgi:hypothetical protein
MTPEWLGGTVVVEIHGYFLPEQRVFPFYTPDFLINKVLVFQIVFFKNKYPPVFIHT